MNRRLQLRYFVPLAAWDVFSKLCSPASWSRLCHRSYSSLRVPEDFFGINIASSEDERCDDYVIARLQELGIDNVRLAVSYGSFDGPPARFLDKLLENRFVVTLVVLPPLEHARQMLVDDRVQEEWQAFIAEAFSRYAGRVAVFEIGSTPNRKKWSGFRPRGYLRAWELACDAAKDYSVTLAGPNIQDFEPFHNAAVLFAMRRISRVPDIHTNNLFVERVVEPEAFDHRVMGRWATGLLKLNLAKKARLLQHLGARAGCRQTISTCKFWTTKRLRRRALFPQDKKVDYLARYLVLAATSGALGRVYWGPMICSRDGLIDDQAEGYPQVDHSTFYQRVRGDVDDFVVTPAFFALGYISQRLKNAYCDRAVSSVDGLNQFAFTGADKDLFHVCWCRDGRALRLADLYSEAELSEAVFTDACGKIVHSPASINERPLFIDFPHLDRQPSQQRSYRPDGHDLGVVYACLPELQGVPWKNRQWRGAYTSTPGVSCSPGDELTPEKIAELPELEVLRDRRNRLWKIEHPLDPQKRLTVKLNRPRGIKLLTDRFKPSKGQRHWNTASAMLQRGISTPMPVAFYERHNRSGTRTSYYICEFIPDTFSSRHVCAAFRQGKEEFKGLDKHQWFDLLTRFICKMHNSGILHRDLSVGNLMLKQGEGGEITPYLIDIGRARLRKTAIGGRHRILDLMRICYKLDWPDRKLFIEAYCTSWGKTFLPYWRLALGYYDFKQGSKKKLKAKIKKKRPAAG